MGDAASGFSMREKSLREECGVFGVFGSIDAARLTYLGLHALQHRGQESSGMVVGNGNSWKRHVGMGWVDQVYDPTVLDGLPGNIAIGHNRYSTSGSSTLPNAQPILFEQGPATLALCHNGTLLNATELAPGLPAGASDTRALGQSLAAIPSGADWMARVAATLGGVRGAYSMLLVHGRALYAARDPYGFRPLALGRRDNGWVVASESCAFDLVGARFEREVDPGELIIIDDGGWRSERIGQAIPAPCVFEWIYFSRPDSTVFGRSVGEMRIQLGRQLAREAPVEADCVVSVPDSGNFAALGFVQESGIPLAHGLIRNHYVGRTFIEPLQATRDFNARVKYNVYPPQVRDRRVVLVDDSLVRGTTFRALAHTLRQTGARQVHARIAAPPLRHGCFFGVDIPDRTSLIAAGRNEAQIAEAVGVDSVRYLSLEGVMAATRPATRMCHGCFSGRYPVAVGDAPVDSEWALGHDAAIA
ncbi:MAG: amidophosphoribosyltransferase [Candidatus Binatia bacterium]